MALKIKKDDTVMVLSGKDRGVKGKVIACYPKTGKVMVEGAYKIDNGEKSRVCRKCGASLDK